MPNYFLPKDVVINIYEHLTFEEISNAIQISPSFDVYSEDQWTKKYRDAIRRKNQLKYDEVYHPCIGMTCSTCHRKFDDVREIGIHHRPRVFNWKISSITRISCGVGEISQCECGYRGLFRRMWNHYPRCKLRIMKCPLCDWQGIPFNFQRHLKKCANEVLTCPQCENWHGAKHLWIKDHVKECYAVEIISKLQLKMISGQKLDPEKLVSCQNCLKKVIRQEMPDHLKKCREVYRRCHDCSKTITVISHNEHDQICKGKEISCPFRKNNFGEILECPWIGKKKYFGKHFELHLDKDCYDCQTSTKYDCDLRLNDFFQRNNLVRSKLKK